MKEKSSSLATTNQCEEPDLSSQQPPCRYLGDAFISPMKPSLLQAKQAPVLQPLLTEPLITFIPSTYPLLFITFLHWGAQSWTQYFICGLAHTLELKIRIYVGIELFQREALGASLAKSVLMFHFRNIYKYPMLQRNATGECL